MTTARTALTATDLHIDAVRDMESELRRLLADTFTLYIKTKNFHWHMRGRHFRDFHLLLDDQADQIFSMTDEIAERARKLGGTTIHSIAEISRNQRLRDNEQGQLAPDAMLTELLLDNRKLVGFLRLAHEICDRHRDVATASLIEVWIDQGERRAWFLAEIVGNPNEAVA